MLGIILDKAAVGVKTPGTQHIMRSVLIALAPGCAAYVWFISPLVLLNIAIAILSAVIIEATTLFLRGEKVTPGIQDGSIVLAAALLALAVPPMLPLWQLLLGVFIMVLLGKQVYGGLGNNPFNPAMVGYAALLLSFPQNMTLWFAPESLNQLGLPNLLNAKFSLSVQSSNPAVDWDGITRATPLEYARTRRLQALDMTPALLQQMTMSSGWLWVNLGFLAGGIYLLYRRIIQWHIPLSLLAGFALCTALFSQSNLPLVTSLFSGALMLGAFFIATDPVTAATSQRGRLVFGFGVGILMFVIREFGGYPEGLAFAVLLMNLCVPLIDHLDAQLASSA